ncbi:MAG: DUF29 domain-containing protein [Pseudomonadota bacterium]|nr:DUF29 domain-containing protein [Pseudomonadota bacterium]
MTTLYDTDFYTWTQRQASLLRQGRTDDLDLEHLAEEIESMGKRDRRALGSHLRNILLHLLKWQFQPALQGPSWRRSIANSRTKIEVILKDSPSLKRESSDLLSEEYDRARRLAMRETSLSLDNFPAVCPWTLEQVLDEDFWP